MKVQMQKNLQEKSDEQLLQEDVWHLKELKLFAELEGSTSYDDVLRGHSTTILDFTSIRNFHIREEVKSFYRHLLLERQRSVTTISRQISVVNYLIRFLGKQKFQMSVLERPLEALYGKYQRYLSIDANLQTFTLVYTLDAEQKPKVYVEASDTLNELKKLYGYLEAERIRHIPEKEKDIWDVRNLDFQIDTHDSRLRTKINFTGISQPNIRLVVKQYIYERLKVRKLSCVFEDMKALKLFSSYLREYHPDVNNLSEISRDIVAGYLAWLNKQDYVMTTKRSRKGGLDTFFKLCRYLEIGNLPQERLITPKDHYFKQQHIPQLIDDEVIDNLNRHLDELPLEVQTITYLLENLGLRINEASTMSIDCLHQDSAGGYYLEYYQSKTSHINRVPISNTLAAIVEAQAKHTKEMYPSSPYLMTNNGEKPFAQESWSFYVNRLSYKYKIKDENGHIVRFKAHQFRHVVATKYALAGMPVDMIRRMLGHTDLKSVSCYIELRDLMADNKIKEFYQHEEARYHELRQMAIDKKKHGIPLAYGYCNHHDLCDTALACYTCGMFQMDGVDSELNRKYLAAIQKRISELDLNGQRRQLELFRKMEKTIRMGLDNKNGK